MLSWLHPTLLFINNHCFHAHSQSNFTHTKCLCLHQRTRNKLSQACSNLSVELHQVMLVMDGTHTPKPSSLRPGAIHKTKNNPNHRMEVECIWLCIQVTIILTTDQERHKNVSTHRYFMNKPITLACSNSQNQTQFW